MSANQYFRTAAAEVRKAAAEKRHELDVLKRQLTEQEQMARQKVEALKADKNQKERQAGDPNNNDQSRLQLEREAQQDLAQTVEVEKQATLTKQSMQQNITALERDIMNIEQTARALESRS